MLGSGVPLALVSAIFDQGTVVSVALPAVERECPIPPNTPRSYHAPIRRFSLFVAAHVLLPWVASAQGLTGTLVGTVKDHQGGAVVGARVEISSPALIGGSETASTNSKGQLRFTNLAPGAYVLVVAFPGFTTDRAQDILIRVSTTTDIAVVLQLAGVTQSVEVQSTISRMEGRIPGVGTHFGAEDLATIPTRRAGIFDLIKATPGISPTSPSSGTVNTISAFGSSTNENSFLIDGTDFTSPSNGAARADPGVDFVQEVHVQSVGASVEYGNAQGAVVNVVTRQGGNRFLYDASYYGQTASLTSQPVRLPIAGAGGLTSGYARARYRDVTTSLGGPVVRDRLWFFAGYQYVRDYDSQPGTDPRLPRISEEDNIFGKLTWRLAPGWQLVQSVHNELWVNAEQPTIARPFETTLRFRGSVPAMTFAHLTHTWSANTVWDVRIGRFAFSQEDEPSTDNLTTPNRFDQVTKLSSGAPPQIGNVKATRTTAKATLTQYRSGSRADHEWKVGGQVETGAHQSLRVIPTGVRFIDDAGSPFQAVSSAPSNAGGEAMNVAAFVSDAVTAGDRLTINAGLRFDHSRAISQDLAALDSNGREVGETVRGLGTLYTWNVLSPRLGVTVRLSADGRTLLRASYGRYTQGVLTGEISPLHPGVTAVVTNDFVPSDGGYTRVRSVVDRGNLQLDPETRPPRTNAYSIGLDRDIGGHAAVAIAYVRKDGGTSSGGRTLAVDMSRMRARCPTGVACPCSCLPATRPRAFSG